MLILKGRVIDATGAPPIEKGLVAIDGNKILTVCRQGEFPVPDGAETIDVGDGTIMPGFIEQHCHLGGFGAVNMAEWYGISLFEMVCQCVYDMGKLLEAGFTSVREVGGFANFMKEPIKKGTVKGPRITASGAILSQTGGHMDMYQKFPVWFNDAMPVGGIVDGVDAMRKACRNQFRNGAEFIKICTTGGITSSGDDPRSRHFSDSEILTAVEEAEMHNSYVSSHAQTLPGIRSAVRCGVKSLEHVYQMDDETLELIIKKGAWVVPTFAIGSCYSDNVDKLPPATAAKVRWAAGQHQGKGALWQHMQVIKKIYEAGVKIGYGSDMTSAPGISEYGENNLREFRLLTEMGMSNMEAIIAATRTGAELVMKEDQAGTLEKDKLADITVCGGNPLEDINLLTRLANIKLVIQDGKIIKNIL